MVINLVGVLAERRAGDFNALQAEGAGRVARIAAASGVSHLLQMSAIGASADSQAKYARSKAEGEALVRQHFPRAVILRPSLVFGPEDQFFNRFASMARLSPIMPVIAGATRFQPVYVGDVADAVMAALSRDDAAGVTYELGGPKGDDLPRDHGMDFGSGGAPPAAGEHARRRRAPDGLHSLQRPDRRPAHHVEA